MPRSELLFLKGENDIPIIARERLLNVAGPVTHDDDDGRGARLPRCSHDMVDHGLSAHGMQNLRQR